VLEYGVGEASTVWLLSHGYEVTSVELNREWVKRVISVVPPKYQTAWRVHMVTDERQYVVDRHYDAVFVDGGNHLHRVPVAQMCMDSGLTDHILMHDTESAVYRWKDLVMREGWHKANCTLYTPWTTVLTKDAELAKMLISTMRSET